MGRSPRNRVDFSSPQCCIGDFAKEGCPTVISSGMDTCLLRVCPGCEAVAAAGQGDSFTQGQLQHCILAVLPEAESLRVQTGVDMQRGKAH